MPDLLSLEYPSVTGYFFNKGTTANRRYIAGLMTAFLITTSTTGPTVNTLYAMPFPVGRATKFDTIECEVTTAGASSNIRMGVYRDDGNCYPGVLVFDSGNISGATTGAKSATITASLQLFRPGLYWITYENSATVPQVRCWPGSGAAIPILGHATPLGAATAGAAYTVAHTVGALPNPYTTAGTIRNSWSVSNPIPCVALRAIP